MSAGTMPSTESVVHGHSLLSADDLYFFNEGTHYDLWKKLGAHVLRGNDVSGTHFAVWAPNAERVSVIGDFNQWDKKRHPLRPRGTSGIWEGLVPHVEPGTRYKYHIVSRGGGYEVDKADPFGFQHECSPGRASVVCELDYDWNDREWMVARAERNRLAAPI